MSDTKENRFEIDLDEIERQLRRSAEGGAPSAGTYQSDPLAELARIVGQDDPFVDILGDGKGPDAPPIAKAAAGTPTVDHAPRTLATAAPPVDLNDEEREVLGSEARPLAPIRPHRQEPRFDPVADAYGQQPEGSLEAEDFEPLPPRRSRGRLALVLGVLVLGIGGTAAALMWRGGSGQFASSGPPPLIRADNAPLKVVPQNPGGMEIPDQSRQIYERRPETARSQILDRQEQPIDVREAARSMPPAPAPSAASTPPQVAASTPAVPPTPRAAAAPGTATGGPASAPAPSATPTAPAGRPAAANAVVNALGEPRRVRTVSVRPDGTAFPTDGSAPPFDSVPALIPTTALPPPVQVPTVSIPANPQVAALPSATSAETVPLGATGIRVLPPPRPGRPPAPDGASTSPTIGSLAGDTGGDAVPGTSATPASEPEIGDRPAVSVRPPTRPSGLGQRVAAIAAPEATPDTTAAAASDGTYAVQIATRPTEKDARAAYDRLSDRFATDLGGKPATVTRAEIGGKPVYRIRVTPMSRQEANTLCTRLKAAGGTCFVVAN